MDNNYKLDKEYKISFEIFKKAYDVFQKKNVYPKSYLFMGLFLVIGIIYIFAAIEDPSNKLAYILVFLSFALAFREWYNPKKIRRNFLDAVRELDEDIYRITIDDEFVEISTLESGNVENSPENNEKLSDDEGSDNSENDDDFEDEQPEVSKIPINSELSVQEFDEFFLLYIKKRMFYVVPKEGFTEYELEVVRELTLKTV